MSPSAVAVTEKPKKEKRSKKEGKKEKREKKEENVGAAEEVKTEEVEMKDAEDAEEEQTEVKKEGKEKKDKKEKKEKKDKKDRKEKKSKSESDNTTADADAASDSDADKSSSKKRKRSKTTDDEEELEIDVNAPQPPSKKQLRKMKKAGIDPTEAAKKQKNPAEAKPDPSSFPANSSQARSKFGVWIGNLSFATTPPRLTTFLTTGDSPITDADITRVNMPVNNQTKKNRGFAYVDFKTKEGLQHALSLSESLLDGRRVLIKDARDFSNRNATESEPVTKAQQNLSKNPPSKILYVGNLDFDVTADLLKEHFSFAGKIARVRLPTFQDSGKCKGFGFVDFEDVESVKRAMLGLTPEEEQVYQELEGKEEVELHKRRRKRALLGTRAMTMEFGEDPSVRYRKRFGKKDGEEGGEGEGENGGERRERRPRFEKPDNRSKDKGAAYSADATRTGAIVKAEGKKVSFD